MPYRTRRPLLRIAILAALVGGVAIAVPAAATDRVVVVKPGDTLSEIALRYGTTVAQLRELNRIADPNRIALPIGTASGVERATGRRKVDRQCGTRDVRGAVSGHGDRAASIQLDAADDRRELQ